MTIAKKKETRVFNITQLSTRAEENESSSIEGYAAVFNSKTNIGGWFDETIEPGAFARSLSENSDVRALFNHNWDNVLGRTKSGTLRLLEDAKGLNFHVVLLTGSNTAREKREIYQHIASGEAQIIIGTHALIQEKVEYHDLALVVTDEQHRFGVKQREALTTRGNPPNILVLI